MSELAESADRIRDPHLGLLCLGLPPPVVLFDRCDYSPMALNDIDSNDIHHIDHPESFVTLLGEHFVDPIVIE